MNASKMRINSMHILHIVRLRYKHRVQLFEVESYASADDCNDGDMRLLGGETEAEGRVEMCINGTWGTICINKWTNKDTAVVCRYLGFSDVFGGRCTKHFNESI